MCWNDWGIDASTAEEEKHSTRRINVKGDQDGKREDIVFALQQTVLRPIHEMFEETFVPQLELKCDTCGKDDRRR